MLSPNVNYIFGDVINDMLYWIAEQMCDEVGETDAYYPSTYTRITYNWYSGVEWANEFHFYGTDWNGIASPFAYAGHIHENAEHKTTYVSYQNCAAGTYYCVFNVAQPRVSRVYDTTGRTYQTTTTQYYDLVGNLYYFGDDYVYSTNRHYYPDNGYSGQYLYKLAPEKTTFITYYVDANEETVDVKLDKNRYKYTHSDTYTNVDTSLYNTVVGTASSTNESSIPDAYWTHYYGTYMGESIPLLNITEEIIPEGDILGVPIYDKQINTSETLKYGTVAAASLTFTLNMPVEEAIEHDTDLLVLWYDFTHDDTWTAYGFFYIDNIEAIDEYTTRLVGHDEAYKLNKYVDGFLETYSTTTTLEDFYTDLLDYCGCDYDPGSIGNITYNPTLNNVYHAVKTTGTEVAHYIAAATAAFIHANVQGDMIIQQYQNSNRTVDTNIYTDLKYSAYNSDGVNKVKICANNAVIGEDTRNAGENVYYVSDNPIISTMNTTAILNGWANKICDNYLAIPAYRPAEIKFLISPNIKIGEIFVITTPGGESYNAIAMAMSIDSTGMVIKSIGSQVFPVESQQSSQFVNLLNDINSVTNDVANLDENQQEIASDLTELTASVLLLQGGYNNLDSTVATISQRVDTAETNISTTASTVSSLSGRVGTLETTVSAMTVTSSSGLASVAINGNTVNNFALKSYVDGKIMNHAVFATGTLSYSITNPQNNWNVSAMFIGNNNQSMGLFIPITTSIMAPGGYTLFKLHNHTLYGLTTIDTQQMTNVEFWEYFDSYSFTED